MQNYNDIDLLFIRILTRDDVTAYKKLFFDFFAPLCLFAKRYVEQKEVCEDIVQGVFFQGVVSTSSVDSDAAMGFGR